MNLVSLASTSRRFGSSLVVVVLLLCGLVVHAAVDEQVPFTATATAVRSQA